MRRTGTAVLITVSAVVALLPARGSGSEPSLAVYPPQKLPLTFDHRRHLGSGAKCATCHPAAATSASSADRLLPRHAECAACHDLGAGGEGKVASPCRACHPGFDETAHRIPPRVELFPPNLIFSHQQHEGQHVACESCHAGISEAALATREHLPPMRVCLACHEGGRAPTSCGACHPTDRSGRLKVELESGTLIPGRQNPLALGHGLKFELQHGTRAAIDRPSCDACHAERDCQGCHDSLAKPLSTHPNDFLSLHRAAARNDSNRCASCHRLQSFCAACHERAGVGPDADPSLRSGDERVHPPPATWVNTLGPGHHAVAASRDLGRCASCHREESCIACHSDRAGAQTASSPHPPGFGSRCRDFARRNDRPCLKCHSSAALASRGCR